MGFAVFAGAVVGVVEQIGTAQMLGQLPPLFVLVGGDVQRPVGGREGARGGRGQILVAHRRRCHARDEVIGHHPAHRRDDRSQHRHINHRAARPGVEGGGDGEGGGHAANGVGQRITDPQRRAIAIAGDRHDASGALDDLIVGRPGYPGAVLAKTGNGTINQVWTRLFQNWVIETEAGHHPRPEVLQHHVGAFHQPQKHLLAGGRFEVKRDRLLAGVLGQKRHPHAGRVERRVGAQLARQIATSRRLDLNHLGAEMGQLMRAERPRQNIGQIQHAKSGKRRGGHWNTPISLKRSLSLQAVPPI